MSIGTERKPEWFKVRLNTNSNYRELKELVASQDLHTVCKEASCPNIHECWGSHKTAAFMILGDICTRRCRFCDVKTGKPDEVDTFEPYRIAKSIEKMQLEHAFITMVNRDDLPDGGSQIVAETVEAIRRLVPKCSVELLTSDMMGKRESIETLVRSNPAILGHNIETVRRLTPLVRSRSDYDRSLDFLEAAKELDSRIVTKSSIMLGLGETKEEVLEAMDDLRDHRVEMINLGQYLQPSATNAPVVRYWQPAEFDEFKTEALSKGFIHCESGPLVRSSYHAGEQYESIHTETL